MYIHEYMYMYTSSCMWFVVVPEAYKNLVAISQTLITDQYCTSSQSEGKCLVQPVYREPLSTYACT